MWHPFLTWTDGLGLPPAAPTLGGGGKSRKRRIRGLGNVTPDAPPVVIIRGRALIHEDLDTLSATGSVYESPAQIQARQNARILAVLMLS